MNSKKIKEILILARVYIEEGYSYAQAIKKAELEISKFERDKYEK